MSNVLIIDDDILMGDVLSSMTKRLGHDVTHVACLQEGLALARSSDFDLVFLDVFLPDGHGLDALPLIRESRSHPEVIIITGAGDADGAELALRSGAWDYVRKPFSGRAIQLCLTRALRYHSEETSRRLAGAAPGPVPLKRERIIGKSPRILSRLDLVSRAAASEANVLITGETGTGKELFARAIHANSSRSGKPFVVVDCASLPESLVENMLFGHAKGAFTGADKAQEGMISQADGGTLVLDEVGELPLSLQKSFLRVLQERRYRPIGARDEVQSDFRLVAVTNRNLEQMVRNGEFREDLLFRLRSFVIELPPLRDRPDDVEDLTNYFIGRLCNRYGKKVKGFSTEFLDMLAGYEWPGNVRELGHCLESAITAARDESVLFPDHLPVHLRIELARSSFTRHPDNAGGNNSIKFRGEVPKLCDFRENAVAMAERDYLKSLISVRNLNIREACRISGLSRPRLYALLKKYGIARN